MNIREAWSQDVVLTAICDQIEQQKTEGAAADFILITGDLAFPGKADEYALVAEFLDALSTSSGVPKNRIFCIPGTMTYRARSAKTLFSWGARNLKGPKPNRRSARRERGPSDTAQTAGVL